MEEYPFLAISDVHRVLGLPKPVHPLISLIDNTGNQISADQFPSYRVSPFYKITLITKLSGRLKYGQGYYDFDEGTMLFSSPNQMIGNIDGHTTHCGYALIIHPDFLQGYPLARKVRQYGFFSYASHEALHLSDHERSVIQSIFRIIGEELGSRIDESSQDVVIAQMELLLTYANRFYKRQFITRKTVHNDLLEEIELLLNRYFDEHQALHKGIPTVQYLADHLNYSPSYLSDMLRSLTGQNAQQHIHHTLIEKAKEKLSTTNLTVSELAYELGFEHPQSFSKLFKAKTQLTPLKFRQAFSRGS